MPKALFFDLDGTLAATHALHIATWLEVLRPHGIEVDLNLYKQSLSGTPPEEVARELLPDLSDEEVNRLVEAEAESYRGRTTKVGPILGLDDLMDAARERGIRLVLVTGAPRDGGRGSLQALGLAGAFELEVFAEDAETSKPDPGPYNHALEKLGLSPEEVLAFEDSPSGVTAAVGAGIPVVALVTTHGPAELTEVGAEFAVGDFADPAVYERLDRQGSP